MHTLGQLISRTLRSWYDDNAMRLGAALAFYTVFSLAPFLIVVIAVAGVVVDPGAAEQQIVADITRLMGSESGQAVAGLLEGARRPGAGAVAALTSLLTIALGATAVFSELQSGLNDIWHVPASAAGVGGMVRARLRSFALVIGIGLLFVVFLVLRTAAVALQTWLGTTFALANDLLAILMSALMFGMIFKVLPETPVAWRDVGVGAVATAVFFTLGQEALGRYLATSGLGSIYGAAGSLVVILVWVYYSAQVFFLGAVFTHVYAGTYGSRAGTSDGAGLSQPGS